LSWERQFCLGTAETANEDRSDKEKITIIKAMKILRKIEAKGFTF
jgi:hypothetical protein